VIFISSAYWDTGGRKTNEDSLILKINNTFCGRILYAAVADGIGSLDEGETASGYILESLAKDMETRIIPELLRGKSFGYIKKQILKLFYCTSEKYSEYAALKKLSLGSTISFILIFKRKYLIFHLGDSAIIQIKRNHLFGRNIIKRLTPLHRNPDGSLSHCIGSFEFQQPFVKGGRVHNNVGFLVCSDGFLKKTVNLADILSPGDIATEEQVKMRLQQVGRKLKDLGVRDNISALYFKLCRKSEPE